MLSELNTLLHLANRLQDSANKHILTIYQIEIQEMWQYQGCSAGYIKDPGIMEFKALITEIAVESYMQ